MSDMKVKDLADTVGITPERLVDQLNEAGIKVSKPDDLITEDQKQSLCSFYSKDMANQPVKTMHHLKSR